MFKQHWVVKGQHNAMFTLYNANTKVDKEMLIFN